MKINKEVLKLKGFPDSIIKTKWDEAHLQSAAKVQRLAVELYEGECSCFTFNDGGVLVDRVLDDESFTVKDMLAVNFVEYFAETLSTGYKPIDSKFLYIYGIGEELANSTAFADKVLSNLIKYNQQRGNSVIVNSDVQMASIFTRNYPLSSALLETKTQIMRTKG